MAVSSLADARDCLRRVFGHADFRGLQAEVIAVGPGKVTDDGKLQPMNVKVGDKILFGKYSGTEVKLGDEELLIMREDDVLGILQ